MLVVVLNQICNQAAEFFPLVGQPNPNASGFVCQVHSSKIILKLYPFVADQLGIG